MLLSALAAPSALALLLAPPSGLSHLAASSSFAQHGVPQEAAESVKVEEDRSRIAVEMAAAFLLTSQESYKHDPPVGGMPDDELAGWQAKEIARLGKIRGQEGAAEWPYEGVYRVGRNGHIPSGYRVGGTSIAAEALLRAGLTGDAKAEAVQAANRALEYVMTAIDEDRQMVRGPKSGYDVRGWGHTYALQFLLVALEEGLISEGDVEPAREMVDDLIDRLKANVTSQGGWNYANNRTVSPFMTGATLLILFDAAEAGFDVDSEMVSDALDALEANATETTSCAYSGKARGDVAMPGSSARSSVATLALFRAGRRSVDDLRLAVDGFFEGWDELLKRKSQQGTHVGKYGIAPYYFFFGHTYAAYAIEELPEAERQAKRDELSGLFWKTQDEDGTWNDRIFPRTASYSTAMVILSLRASERPRFAQWTGKGDKDQ